MFVTECGIELGRCCEMGGSKSSRGKSLSSDSVSELELKSP